MGFKVSMLEYCKIILEKLSFNRTLFHKEYKKSFRYLQPEERVEFKRWVRDRYREMMRRHKFIQP
jgi:hypothetical protein